MPRFITPNPITATISVAISDIAITASDREDTVVSVSPSDATKDVDVRAAAGIQTELAEGMLRVTGPWNRLIGPTKKSGSVKITIEVPTDSAVAVEIGMGAIRGFGQLGPCRMKTSMGDIHLADTAGIDLKTGFGDLIVHSVTGDAKITTGSGAIRVGQVEGSVAAKNSNGGTVLGAVSGGVSAKADNGDVAIESAGSDVTVKSACGDLRVGCVQAGAVELRTAAGRIEVGIRSGTAALLDLHTSFGAVTNHLDNIAHPDPSDATVRVHAVTGLGDIDVRRASA